MLAAEEPKPAVVVPIDGILDLHAFRPRDLGTLVPEYLEQCRRRGILQARLVHGKGTGALARGVQALLRRLPAVVGFRLAGPGAGDWGATLVWLAPLAPLTAFRIFAVIERT